MAQAENAQGRSCAINNVVLLDLAREPKRGRPKKNIVPTPAAESFEFYADQTKHIPNDPRAAEPKLHGRRGWLASRDYARQEAFRDPRLTPVARALFSLLIDCVNRTEGYEYLHGYGGFARKLACHTKSAQRAMRLLVETGYAVRKERFNGALSWHHVSMTALPTLVRASFISAQGSELEFSADTPPPNGGDTSAERRGGLHEMADLTYDSTSRSTSDLTSPAWPWASQEPTQAEIGDFEELKSPKVEIIMGDRFRANPTGKRKSPKTVAAAGTGETPEKRNSKRRWLLVSEAEKAQLWIFCQAYAAERGWSPEFLKARLVAFDNHQKSRQIMSADWQAELENWLDNPHYQPHAHGRSSRPSVSEIVDNAFIYED